MSNQQNVIRYTKQIESLKHEFDLINESEFINRASFLNKQGNCICECIPDDEPIKLYYDVEFKGKGSYQNTADIRNRLVNDYAIPAIKYVLKDIVPDNIVLDDIVLDASSDSYQKNGKQQWIISAHIIINNVLADKKRQKHIINCLNNYMKEAMGHYMDYFFDEDGNSLLIHPYKDGERADFFDSGVYDPSQKMRIFGSDKHVYGLDERKRGASNAKQNRPLKLIKGTPEKSIITGFIPNDAITIQLPKKSIFQETSRKTHDSLNCV